MHIQSLLSGYAPDSCTGIPRGFTDSPAIFVIVNAGITLPPNTCLLQYTGNILVSGSSKEMYTAAFTIVYNVLAEAGFKASREKLKMVERSIVGGNALQVMRVT